METFADQGIKPTIQKIRDLYGTMTRTQKKISDLILDNPSIVLKSSITELCNMAEVKSEASMVRFYRVLGFNGYKEFKIQMAQELADRTFYHSYEDINIDDSPSEIKDKIFRSSITTLNTNMHLDNEIAYEQACDMILHANRIIFLGYAASAAICYYAYFRFIELGFNCNFTADSHINAAVLARPNPNDLIFCISHSGETRDLITPLEKIAHKDIPIILVTGSEKSTLARLSDVVILTRSEETNIVTDAMNSRVVQLCTIDSLFSIVSIAKGKDALSRLVATRKTFMDYKK